MKLAALFFFVGCNALFAQKHQLVFHPIFGNSLLHFDETYYSLSDEDSLQIETFRFYISNIELLNKNQVVWREKNSVHLIDAAIQASLSMELHPDEKLVFNQIRFNLGIDSTTNVSGAMGGDLDPTQGMYWAWQSGYINFKLEGKSDLCATRNKEFQFHLGGYSYPHNALKTITLKVVKRNKTDVIVNVKNFLSQVDLTGQNHIMSPSKDAVVLAEKALKMFTVRYR